MEKSVFDSKEYKISRRAYSAQCMFEYFIALLSADAFLAKLLKNIGLSDAATGIISSLISLTFLFQLFSIPLAGKIKDTKKSMIFLDTISQLLFAGMYLIPFSPFSPSGKAAAVTVIIILGYLTLYLNSSICYKWGNSFVSPDRRGRFSAVKEMVSLIGGMIFTLFAGFVTDKFEEKNDLNGAFAFLSAAMAVVCIFNFICLSLMKNVTLSESRANQSIKAVFAHTLRNKKCRRAIILTSLNEFARYFTVGFLGTYKTCELGFSVGQVQLLNIGANLGRFAISKPFGKYSDRHSFAGGFYVGLWMTLAAFIIGIFIKPETRWLIIPFTVIYNMSCAGTGQNTFNMMYSYVDDEYILSAMSVNNSIRGVAGFIASLLGSSVLTAVQSRSNSALGFSIYGQQLLCGISAILTACALVFNKKAILSSDGKQTELVTAKDK